LHLALLTAEVEPGDEVILPSLTFIAAANAVRFCGAKPVFADVERDTLNIDPVSVGSRITSRTKAVLAVHQFGRPADLDALRSIATRHGCSLFEDAACALGSEYKGRRIGSHSPTACFSFHPRKIITTGEGGMIVTSDAKVAERLRQLRHHGMDVTDWQRHQTKKPIRESFSEVGFNYRMSDMSAAVGVVQMQRLDGLLATRRRLAAAYDEAFRGHPFLEMPAEIRNGEGNAQTYALSLSDDAPVRRNELLMHMRNLGIVARHGLACIHLEPAYADEFGNLTLPHSEWLAERMFLLPLYPEMTPTDVNRVIQAVLTGVEARTSPGARIPDETAQGRLGSPATRTR